MVANISKLKGKIAENGYTMKKLAEEMKMSEATLRRKINDAKFEFYLGETVEMQKILNLTNEEYLVIFHNWNLN